MTSEELKLRFRWFWPVWAEIPEIGQEIFGYVVNWENDRIKIQTEPHNTNAKIWVRAEGVRPAWEVSTSPTIPFRNEFPEK